MDHRVEEIDESGNLTATYVESSSNGRQRIDVIVSHPDPHTTDTVPPIVG